MDEKITVCCLLWEGAFKAPKYVTTTYSAQWVEKLRNMVRRHLDMDYEFVCLTNVPDLNIEDVRTIPLTRNLPGWWAKPMFFARTLPIETDKIIYFDLDVFIMDDISPLLDLGQSCMKICPAFSYPKKKVRGVLPGYNSSVMCFNRSINLDIWDLFEKKSEDYMRAFRGDQDFLYYYFDSVRYTNDVVTYPDKWIRKLGEFTKSGKLILPEEDLKVLLSMPLKNDKAVLQYAKVAEVWK